jgi:transcriptional regulator with PAS, ATPase and Fis domain
MIDWNEIIESNDINVFRKICFKLWGADVQFFDKHNNWKSNSGPLKNPLCSLLHSKESGAKLCLQSYRKHLKDLSKSQTAVVYECNAGVNGVAAPVYVKEKYVGAVVCSGIQLRRNDPDQDMYVEKLEKLGFDKTTLVQVYNKQEIVEGQNEECLLSVIELLAEEVSLLYEMLCEKSEASRSQSSALEIVYNEKYKGIIGASPEIKKVFDTLESVEECEDPVLIEGESGTGKELLAATIHYNSPRRDKLFIMQNCSEFSNTLLCSELFGHEKGACAGAISEKEGLFEIADGGTLLLDKIGDMGIDTQVKLLRVLESGTFYRVGGTEQKNVNTRIIAATNKELKTQVERGLFRKDLFYRINTLHIIIPPLKERKEDITVLTDHFLQSYADIHDEEIKTINQNVAKSLMAYHWPGNVRELKNVVERMIILSGKKKLIEEKQLPSEIKAKTSLNTYADNRIKDAKLGDTLESIEKEIVEKKLKMLKWNKSAASRELGISRASLNYKIAQFDILQEP